MDINGAKNQRESFESAATSDDSFMTASEGLIVTEEMDDVADYPLLKCTAPSEGQALPAVNAGQSNFQRSGRSRRGISSAVSDEEAQLSPAVSSGPPQRPTQTAGRGVDSVAGRNGLSFVLRLGPKRVVDTPQPQALLKDLTDPSATISEGNGNNEEDTAAANVQRSGRLERGISSEVMDKEVQLSPIVSTRAP